ncbi:hypothetical protein AB1K70_07610 [Bremerella sp. JC770]|uniref:hypothetical protein n=1 Tax=Bremerella sp. JC770 TaxID=3232137 RepID=UPI003457EE85
MSRLNLTVVLLPMLLVGLVGCQQNEFETAPIHGTITLNGEPVQGARVLFIPSNKKTKAAGGETDRNGQYEIRFTGTQMGSTIGPHRVKVMYEPESGGRERAGRKSTPKISPKFLNGNVEVEVQDTDNVFDFELTET